MAIMQEEHVFDPNATELPQEDDLGEFKSYVDQLEATENQSEEVVEEVEASAELEEVEEEAVLEEEEDVPDVSDALANPDENAMIPRERLNQANRKRQEESDRAESMSQRVRELEAEMQRAVKSEGIKGIDAAAIKEAAEKVLDGDTDAFSNILAEQMSRMVPTFDTEALLQQATDNAVAVMQQNMANSERAAAADVWISKYPALDINNKNAVNEDALAEANQLIEMYEAKGYKPAVALERAVKATVAMYGLDAANVTPIAAPKAVPSQTIKKTPRTIKQPPATGEGGANKTDSPEINSQEISQDEWDALPESTRDAIMNGG